MVFLQLFHQAHQACGLVSDQCADAGFAWEVSGKLLLTAAVLILLAALIILFIQRSKRNAKERAPLRKLISFLGVRAWTFFFRPHRRTLDSSLLLPSLEI